MQTKLDEWYDRVKAARLTSQISLNGTTVKLHRTSVYKFLMGSLGIIMGSLGWVVYQYQDGTYFLSLAVILSLLGFIVVLGVFKVLKIDLSAQILTVETLGVIYKKVKLDEYIVFGIEVGSRYGMSMYHCKVHFARGFGIQIASFTSEKAADRYNYMLTSLLRINRVENENVDNEKEYMNTLKITNTIIGGGPNGPMVADLLFGRNGVKKPVVIFVHGFKGYKDWGTFNLVADQLANAGFVVLKFNFTHNGGTLQDPIDFPDLEAFGNNNYTKEQQDLGHVIDWIQTTQAVTDEEVDRNTIYLVGHSRGGGGVILKAFHDARIKKVVTWAAVSDFGARFKAYDIESWKGDGVAYIMNGRTKQNMPLYYQFYEDFIQNEDALDIPKAAKGINIPFLICHGTDDPAVPLSEAHNLKEWNPNAEMFTVEGAGHTFDGAHPWEQDELPQKLQSLVDKTIDFLKA